MNGYAKYEVMRDGEMDTARLYVSDPGDYEFSAFEQEVEKVIENRCCESDLAGRFGYTLDPYKTAETILADHYGYAKMVEAHYEWRPKVRY